MTAVANIDLPVKSHQDVTAQYPHWTKQIVGAVECLSLNEAKDILKIFVPNATVSLVKPFAVIAIRNNIKYEIIAFDMKHDWSEQHSTDSIVVNAYCNQKKVLSNFYALHNLRSIRDLIAQCSFH